MRGLVLIGAVLAVLPLGSSDAVETVLDVELEGRVVLDGEADERLRGIGQRAARENLALQVSAPDLWERRILEPIRAGAGDTSLTIKYVNALSDVVGIKGIPANQAEDPLETLKRITSSAKAHAANGDRRDGAEQPPPAASPEPEPASQPPEIERPAMDMSDVEVERPRASLPMPGASRPRARVESDDTGAGEPGDVPTPGETRPREAVAEETGPRGSTEAAPAPDQARVKREREQFERIYNRGRAIRESIPPDRLETGDFVYTGRFHDVVVRPGLSNDVYWLEGTPPEDRLQHEERNRYRVTADAPEASLAGDVARPPDTAAAERKHFEDIYNGGREITGYVEVSELRPGDTLYVGDKVTAVVRREGVGMDTYWLGEPVSLDQPGIAHERKNKYIVVGELN